MLYFIPAWYKENEWSESEQYWYIRRARSEFDDTVKHVQLFHRRQAYPFRILLFSFAPNFRHFLHRQGVFRAPYWSCFDAIQEIRRKKVMNFSYHNLNWPSKIEFVYSPFVMIARLKGKKYAQAEFGEDGNLIQIDMFQDEQVIRRNIYDDRGFVGSTIVYENGVPVYQDYLTDTGVWKIRHFKNDGHVEVNPKCATYLLEYEKEEYSKKFSKLSYESMEQVIEEVVNSYLEATDENDLFCAAMHELHIKLLKKTLKGRKTILSFFGDRYDIKKHVDDIPIIERADYIITDSEDNLHRLQKEMGKEFTAITDITPFDSRVDFGISQQLNVQKILVPIDGMREDIFKELIVKLGEYLGQNENARVHLFSRVSNFGRKKEVLEAVRTILRKAGMEEGWAEEENNAAGMENRLDALDTVPIRFFVEQCVDELAVSKCMREQRVMLDMRRNPEVYMQITCISMGIPQIIYSDTQFVKHMENGMILKDVDKVGEALSFYLENLTNWNEAMVSSYEIGKKYTTEVLIKKWKEVIDFVGRDSNTTIRN